MHGLLLFLEHWDVHRVSMRGIKTFCPCICVIWEGWLGEKGYLASSTGRRESCLWVIKVACRLRWIISLLLGIVLLAWLRTTKPMLGGAGSLFRGFRSISLPPVVVGQSGLVDRDSHWLKVVVVELVAAARPIILTIPRELLMALLLLKITLQRPTSLLLLELRDYLRALSLIWCLSFPQEVSLILFGATGSSCDGGETAMTRLWMSFVTIFTRAACDRRARNLSLMSYVILLTCE